MEEQLHQLIEWWQAIHSLDLVLAVALPTAILLLRRWLSDLLILGIIGIVRRFGLLIEPTARSSLRPAMTGLLGMLAAFLGISVLDLPGAAALIVLSVLQSLLVFGVFWLINALILVLLEQAKVIGVHQGRLRGSWISQIVRFLLVAIAVVVVLNVWGIDLGPALTGLGIAGAAVALAAQDQIRNLLAGFNIAAERRFREGDWIRISQDVEGIVEKIDLRSTVIRRFDNGTEHIPNSELANNSLSNFSRRTARRLRWTIALTYGTETETLNSICEEIASYINTSDRFVGLTEANLFVRLYALEESSIDILVDCFVAANEYSAELDARHELILAIKKIVEGAGAEFAFPSRSVYTENKATGLAGSI
ncbi:mechanosensitive ion channel family protein [Parasedimentitalea psychrophila]|uniref:Mechanosensitive ion channel n=1 Tax=Parasedimentitalea psychrophila TaxID=2997337 RepID=A0A9Y2KWM4_9RHOB|nr:mechanosensitive ion channel domain-containing protein [Parasedimentitalea psychrophila]WIY23903.1 mechanosensitive ion channel [Parasedimentitalea psychrophila]